MTIKAEDISRDQAETLWITLVKVHSFRSFRGSESMDRHGYPTTLNDRMR
ncbi:MAG: hypothetical protein ACERKS_12980 [Candidatus Bathyarchaeota archaeon]